MQGTRVRLGGLAILTCLIGAASSWAAPAGIETSPTPIAFAPLPPLDTLPEQFREQLRVVLKQPALHARGPVETFRCDPEMYFWLLDHPDRVCKGWQHMGARCAAIQEQGPNHFGCKDENGNVVHWDTVVSDRQQHIWYAEGLVRPGRLLPSVKVRAIVVIHIVEGRNSSGRSAVRHQAELILHTDSKAVALATRLFGMSAPRMAEQYVGQIQTFFAAMAWYVNEHPEKRQALLGE
jgi:hypothetical protein